MGETKTRSFRIDDETAEAFKQICSEVDGNQQETLSKLIQTFELQKCKTTLAGKKEAIEKFETYSGTLVRMFMDALEENQNSQDIIRTEFDALLRSKDTTIQELQEKSNSLKAERDDAAGAAQTCREEMESLYTTITSLRTESAERIKSLESMLSDKDNLNQALASTCDEQKIKLEEFRVEIKETKKLQDQLTAAKLEQENLQKENKDLLKELDSKDAILKQELEKSNLDSEKRLFAVERDYQKKMQELENSKKDEIDKYQGKYLGLLEKMAKLEKPEPALDTPLKK